MMSLKMSKTTFSKSFKRMEIFTEMAKVVNTLTIVLEKGKVYSAMSVKALGIFRRTVLIS